MNQRDAFPLGSGNGPESDATSAPGDPSATQSPPPLPSLPRRVLMVIVSPVELFRSLRDHPVVLGPLVLGAILVGAAAALIPVELTQELIREQMIEAGQDLGEGVGTAARVMWVSSIFGPLIFWPIMAVITAGLYSLVFLFAFGYEGRFRQMLSVTAHALLVAAIGTLLVAPLRVVAADAQMTLSLGSLLFFLEEGFLATFLGLLDLFNLWTYLLIGVGAAVVDGTRAHAHGVLVALGTAILISAVIASFIA